jgi:predicted DNA repair protein MutK
VDLVALEKEKIKGAVRTDFVLSAEIVAIALGTVATAAFMTRVGVLVGLALLMTVGVYGLVAGIVKIDDAGAWLTRRGEASTGAAAALQRAFGLGIVSSAPWLMKGLSVAGTIAMFLVGGGILSHGIPGFHELVHHWSEAVAGVPGIGGVLAVVLPSLVDLLTGVVAGSVILAAVMLVKSLRRRATA